MNVLFLHIYTNKWNEEIGGREGDKRSWRTKNERIKSNWLKMSVKMKIVNWKIYAQAYTLWQQTYQIDWFNRSKEFAVNFDDDSCAVYSLSVWMWKNENDA